MAASKIHIGTSGWNYKHRIETFYPEDLKAKDWLGFYNAYASQNSLEINNMI